MLKTESREDVEAFSAALAEFTRAQRRARGRFNSAPAVPELSFSQYLLLEPLARAGDAMCVGALAESAGVSPPSATRMVDGLAKRGIVERVRDPDDRRQVRVELTPAGALLYARKQDRISATHTRIFDQLSATERRTAAKLLTALAGAVEELHP